MKVFPTLTSFVLALSVTTGCSKNNNHNNSSSAIQRSVCEAVEGIQTREGGCIFQQEAWSKRMVYAVDTNEGSCVILALPEKEPIFTEKTDCTNFLGKLGKLREAFLTNPN